MFIDSSYFAAYIYIIDITIVEEVVKVSEVVVSSKYQIVIPAEVRKSLSIKKGQKLHLIVENGAIRLIPSMPFSEMRGLLHGMDTKTVRDEEDRF